MKYSKSSKNFDHLYSYHTVEKLRENNLKRVVCNLWDPTDKVKVYPNHSKYLDRYLEVVDPNSKVNPLHLPTIRMICPSYLSKSSIVNGLSSLTLKRNRNDYSQLSNDNRDNAEETLEERQKMMFMKRNQEIKLRRILTIQKLNTFSPEVGRYSPNYSSIEKKTPSALIFSYSEQKEKKSYPFNTPIKEIINEKEKGSKITTKRNAKSLMRSSFGLKKSIDDDLMLERQSKSKTKKLPSTPSYAKVMMPNSSVSVITKSKNALPKRKDFAHSISFKEMRGREMKVTSHVHKQNTPTLGTYNPQFNCIEKYKTAIIFNGKTNKSDSNKKYIMNKVIRSYNIKNDYIVMQLIHKAKENNDNKG